MITYIGGYHLVYTFYQQGLKLEMKSYLKANKLSNFGIRLQFDLNKGEIDNPSFAWEEKGEEFKFNNEYYDVVAIDQADGKVMIVCIKDENENQLEMQLNQIYKSGKNSTSSSRYAHVKFFSFFHEEFADLKVVFKSPKSVFIEANDSNWKDYYSDIFIPPPRC